MLTAALTSRSWTAPQAGHVQVRTDRSFTDGSLTFEETSFGTKSTLSLLDDGTVSLKTDLYFGNCGISRNIRPYTHKKGKQPLGYRGALLVQEVLPLVGDMAVELCDPPLLPAVVVGFCLPLAGAFPAGQDPLGTGKALLRLPVILWGPADLPVGGYIQAVRLVVKADGVLFRRGDGRSCLPVFVEHGTVISAVAFHRYRGGLQDMPFRGPRVDDGLHLPYPGQLYTAVKDGYVAAGQVRGIGAPAPSPGLEPWVPGGPIEHALIGAYQGPRSVRKGELVNVPPPAAWRRSSSSRHLLYTNRTHPKVRASWPACASSGHMRYLYALYVMADPPLRDNVPGPALTRRL